MQGKGWRGGGQGKVKMEGADNVFGNKSIYGKDRQGEGGVVLMDSKGRAQLHRAHQEVQEMFFSDMWCGRKLQK